MMVFVSSLGRRMMTMTTTMTTRRWSSSSNSSSSSSSNSSSSTARSNSPHRVAAAKSYLEAWVGSSNTTNNNNNNHHYHHHHHPLLVSGTSYRLATLRLEKTDTPDSVLQRLQEFHNTSHSKRRLPLPLPLPPHSNNNNNNNKKNNNSFKAVPIVLDLRAWAHTGSPHDRPPPIGSLKQMVSVLERQHGGGGNGGLTVIGVHGTPPILQKEASQELGLPALWSSNQHRQSAIYYGLEDILDMVIVANRKQQQRPYDEPPIIIEEEEEEQPQPQPQPQEDILTNAATSNEKDCIETSTTTSLDATIPSVVYVDQDHDDDDDDDSSLSSITQQQQQQLPPISSSATIYRGTVRSGQQVSSEQGCSLVILGSVSSGGEVLSDSDVFVFGKLRGRALAGLSSSSSSSSSVQARIIATSMDPELVSVGGVLWTGEELDHSSIVSSSTTGGSSSSPIIVVSLNADQKLVFEKI